MTYLMTLIDEIVINDTNIRFYKGIDFEMILNHPKDGSNGMLYFFIDKWSVVEQVHNRQNTINSLLNESEELLDIHNIDNNYIVIYQTNGDTDVVYSCVRDKLNTFKEDPWIPQYNLMSRRFNI